MTDQNAMLREGIRILQFSWAGANGVEWIDVAIPLDGKEMLGAAAAAVLHLEFHPEQRGEPDSHHAKAALDAYDVLVGALRVQHRHPGAPGVVAIDRNYRLALYAALLARMQQQPEEHMDSAMDYLADI